MMILKDVEWTGPGTFEEINTHGIAPLKRLVTVYDEQLEEQDDQPEVLFYLNRILAEYLENFEHNLFRLGDECEAAMTKETAPQEMVES